MSILTQGGAAGGGSTTDLASPGAIGGTTPAAITATTLSVTNPSGLTTGLQVGSGSTTTKGWYFGYGLSSGICGIWETRVTPDATNSILLVSGNGQIDLGGATASGGSLNVNFGGTLKTTWINTAGRGPDITAGTATTAVNALSITQTRNNSGVTFPGVTWTFTDTAVGASSTNFVIKGGASGTTTLFSLLNTGYLKFGGAYSSALGAQHIGDASGGISFSSGGSFFSSNGTNIAGISISGVVVSASMTLGFASGAADAGSSDALVGRSGTNALYFASGSTTATRRTEINKAVTGIADNTATATFTVTVPNGAHSANLRVTLKGSLGAGGAIGANEASASIGYDICIARTAGVNAVATISSAYGSTGSTAVAGAATCAITAALSAISGAVGATNTFTVNVTITRGSGSSTNHTCFAYGQLINDNASGVTVA